MSTNDIYKFIKDTERAISSIFKMLTEIKSGKQIVGDSALLETKTYEQIKTSIISDIASIVPKIYNDIVDLIDVGNTFEGNLTKECHGEIIGNVFIEKIDNNNKSYFSIHTQQEFMVVDNKLIITSNIADIDYVEYRAHLVYMSII